MFSMIRQLFGQSDAAKVRVRESVENAAPHRNNGTPNCYSTYCLGLLTYLPII